MKNNYPRESDYNSGPKPTHTEDLTSYLPACARKHPAIGEARYVETPEKRDYSEWSGAQVFDPNGDLITDFQCDSPEEAKGFVQKCDIAFLGYEEED